MSVATGAETALVVLLAGLLLVLPATLWFRHRVIATAAAVAYVARRSDRSGRWHAGFVRLGTHRLDWFPLVGWSTQPSLSWPRGDVAVGAPSEVVERVPGIPVAVSVPIAGPIETALPSAELGLSREVYTALRSWAESTPPGSTVHVA